MYQVNDKASRRHVEQYYLDLCIGKDFFNSTPKVTAKVKTKYFLINWVSIKLRTSVLQYQYRKQTSHRMGENICNI